MKKYDVQDPQLEGKQQPDVTADKAKEMIQVKGSSYSS